MSEEKYSTKYTRNVKVFIQILPQINTNQEDIKILDDNKTIYARRTQDFGKGNQNVTPSFWTFLTDGVLYNLDQDEIYKTVMDTSLEKAIQGVDVLLTTYGQTGTGKSTTINGLQYTYENRGIAPRIITDLFNLKEQMKHRSEIKLKVSFVEVEKYNFVDLLKTEKQSCYAVKDVTKVKIRSQYEGLKELFYGEGRRRFYNESSYISHAATSVFTIHIKNRSILNTNPVDSFSKIHIIDMAGIDNCGNTSCSWKNCKDVGVANLTKSQLEMFLLLLQDYSKNKNIVKDFGTMVQYLGASLSPQNIIRFVGHIRYNRSDLLFTLSTLRFAHIARCIKPAKLTRRFENSEKLRVENLQTELDNLVKQNYLNSMLINEDLSSNITQTRTEQINNTIEEYLQDKINEISVLNVTSATAILRTFKEMYNKLEIEQMNTMKQTEKVSTSKTRSKMTGVNVNVKSTKGQGSISGTSHVFSKRKSSLKTPSSRKSILEVKPTNVGNLMQSGVSVGLLKSNNYQGVVTRAQKRSRLTASFSEKQSSKTLRYSRQNKSNLSQDASEINLEIKLNEDSGSAWSSYRFNENFNFNELNNKLITAEKSSKDILKEYNGVVSKIESITSSIETKKNDLFNMQLYKTNSNLKCESLETVNLQNVEEKTEMELIELQTEMGNFKERMYTLQAELKINIGYYHKLKADIKDEFKQYCTENFKIQIPSTEENICIEDNLILPDTEATEPKQNIEKHIFEKLQASMKKMQSKILME